MTTAGGLGLPRTDGMQLHEMPMKLYEFEGKRLFDRAGIQIPPGKVVASPEEAARTDETVSAP